MSTDSSTMLPHMIVASLGILPMMQGVKAMVYLSNKAGCEWQEAEQNAKRIASAVFQMARPLAIILVATKDIVLRQHSCNVLERVMGQAKQERCSCNNYLENK